MCHVDLEPCEVWRETKRRARKPHVCDCCEGRIRVGEQYVSHFSVFEGEATTEKMCAKCEAMSVEFQNDHGQRGTPGSMRALLEECIDYGDEDSAKWKRHLANMNRRTASLTRRRP